VELRAYTGELKPDVIVLVWEQAPKEAGPYLQDYVLVTMDDKANVFVRKDSPNILWDRVVVKE
jgi:hypothetical protein